MNLNDDLTRELAKAASSIMYNEAAKLDKVDPKDVKGDFDDREDKDIDNDGDTDSSDEYLHKKRQAISKAIKNESVDLEEGTELYNDSGVIINQYSAGFGGKMAYQITVDRKYIQLDKNKLIKVLQGLGIENVRVQLRKGGVIEESSDLEEAKGFLESSWGARVAYDAVVRLSESLKRGSNLNKAVNKKLGGNYDPEFRKMEKSIGQILDILEEIDREYQMED